MTTTTRGRYANGQLVKVLQTATVLTVIEVPSGTTWRDVKTLIESRAGQRAVKKNVFMARGHTTYIVEISYTAKGANRTDITGRLTRDFGDQLKHCSYSNTVQHD